MSFSSTVSWRTCQQAQLVRECTHLERCVGGSLGKGKGADRDGEKAGREDRRAGQEERVGGQVGRE